ncbi:MAG: hypothetical protein NT107_00195 [Planctomycetota bacterium]|nr:hypothetical protein [Planctomycetota bacterium]
MGILRDQFGLLQASHEDQSNSLNCHANIFSHAVGRFLSSSNNGVCAEKEITGQTEMKSVIGLMCGPTELAEAKLANYYLATGQLEDG